jgi:hypothetical protein
MNLPGIVSRAEWLVARKTLLTRQRVHIKAGET